MNKLSSPVELIKKSWKIFFEKDNFMYFLKIYWPLIPFALFFLVEENYLKVNLDTLNQSNLAQFLGNFGLFGVGLFVGLIELIVSFWVSVAGIKAVSDIIGGQSFTIKETYRFAWKKLWKFSLLSILFSIIVGFGGILLIIPGVYLYISYYFSKFILLEGDNGVLSSLGKSRNLVKGRFWKVFGRVLIFGLFFAVLQIILSFIPYRIGSIIYPLLGALTIIPNYLLYQELGRS